MTRAYPSSLTAEIKTSGPKATTCWENFQLKKQNGEKKKRAKKHANSSASGTRPQIQSCVALHDELSQSS